MKLRRQRRKQRRCQHRSACLKQRRRRRIGILASDNPAPWIWGRIGSDVLDIATLATHLGDGNLRQGNVALALGAVVGMTVLDVVCAQALSTNHHPVFTAASFPPPQTKTAELHRWLQEHPIAFEEWRLKAALDECCRQQAPAPD